MRRRRADLQTSTRGISFSEYLSDIENDLKQKNRNERHLREAKKLLINKQPWLKYNLMIFLCMTILL